MKNVKLVETNTMLNNTPTIEIDINDTIAAENVEAGDVMLCDTVAGPKLVVVDRMTEGLIYGNGKSTTMENLKKVVDRGQVKLYRTRLFGGNIEIRG